MQISIIVPAYNEETMITEVIRAITSFLDKIVSNYELLIIENGSRDKTLFLSRREAEKNPKIKVFHLPHPSYGQALKFGLKKAKGDYIIIFNVDFWEPRFITLAVKDNLLGKDIVVASKNLPQSRDKRPLGRKLVTRGFVLFLRLFLSFKGTDTHGIKILRKKVLQEVLPKCKISSGLFDSELLIRAQRAGFIISEVPVEVREIRPARFKGRFLDTPKDIWELFLALR